MKKNYKKQYLIIVLLLLVNFVFAQSGNDCQNKISITDHQQNDFPITGIEKWFSFVADTTGMVVQIATPLNGDTMAHIKKLQLYGGSCSSLNLIKEVILTHLSDTLPAIFFSSTPALNYFIRVERYANTVCSNCSSGNVSFGIQIINNPSPLPLATAPCFPSTCAGQNLVINGDFESYKLGVEPLTPQTNDMLYYNATMPAGYGTIGNPIYWINGLYGISNTGFGYWNATLGTVQCKCTGCVPPDHAATGNNYYFYGDSPVCPASNPGCSIRAWEQTNIAVVAGNSYTFSAWFKINSTGTSAFEITTTDALLNTTSILGPFTLIEPAEYCWAQYCTTFVPTTTGPITLTIRVFGQHDNFGHDFGIDDIEFYMDNGPLPITLISSPSTTSICSGQSMTLTASGATTYSWAPTTGLNTTTGSVVVASPITTTTYTVTGASTTTCSGTSTKTITIVTPSVNISQNFPSINCGTPVILTATGISANGDTWLWSNGATTQSISVTVAGIYSVTYTDGLTGCQVISSPINIIYTYQCCGSPIAINTAWPVDYASNHPDISGTYAFGFVGMVVNFIGDFIIDVPSFTIDNTMINMDNTASGNLIGPKITINTGNLLEITNNSILHGCKKMWDGIYLSGITTPLALRINGNSRIEDAWNAVVVSSAGNYEIDGAIFNKNYKSLVVKSSPYSGTVVNTLFTCEDWITHVPSNLLGLNYNSQCGIEIYRVYDLVVGDQVSGSTNYFRNMRLGIKIHNSLVHIFHNEFNMIYPCVGCGNDPLNDPSIQPGSAIDYIGPTNSLPAGGIEVRNNVFSNCTRGIFTRKAGEVYVTNNAFTNFTTDGIRIIGNYALSNLYVSPTIEVFNNSLSISNGPAMGIRVQSNPKASVKIRQNTLISTVNLSNSGFGIFVTENGTSANNTLANYDVGPDLFHIPPLAGNTITGFRMGVYAAGLNNAKINENTITFSSPSISGSGIKLYYVYDSQIVGNIIHGTGEQNTFQDGITSFSGDRQIITCNQIFACGKGFHFIDTHIPGTKVAYNDLTHCGNNGPNSASMYFESNGIIGTQGASGVASYNRWLPFGYNASFSPFIPSLYTDLNTVNSAYPFYVRNQIQFNPNFNLNFTSLSFITGNQNPIITTNGIPQTCPLYSVLYIVPPSGQSDDYEFEQEALSMILDTIPFSGPYAETSKWLTTQNLYQALLDYPDFVNNNQDAFDFVDGMNNCIQAKINESFALLAQSQDTTTEIIEQALSVIEGINPQNDPEYYLAKMYKYYFQQFLDKEFPQEEDVIQLQSIASLCPLEDAPAVIMARNMLSIYNFDSLYSNECERNGEQQQRTAGSKKSGSILSNLVNSSLSFLVYPNPTSGNFFIERKGDKTDTYSVSLYDNLGRMRATEILNAGKTEIKTVGLSPGIYFFEISDSKAFIQKRGKLVLFKK